MNRALFNPRLMRFGAAVYALWLLLALLFTGIDQAQLSDAGKDIFTEFSAPDRGLSDAAFQQLVARDIWNHKPLAATGSGAGGLRLIAIASVTGEPGVATVVDAAGQLYRVSVNDPIGDVRVLSISPGELVLQGESETYVLHLYEERKP
jgi:hypothetical protein